MAVRELERVYALGERNGIAALNFAARKRVRYVIPAKEKLEWPEGKDAKPSCATVLPLFLQIVQDTIGGASSRRLESPPTRWSLICSRSGSQRLRRSGLGFPYKSLNISVITKAEVRATPRPRSPVLISQSLRRHIRGSRVASEAVGPGTRRRQTRVMMTAGATMETRRRVSVDMVSAV